MNDPNDDAVNYFTSGKNDDDDPSTLSGEEEEEDEDEEMPDRDRVVEEIEKHEDKESSTENDEDSTEAASSVINTAMSDNASSPKTPVRSYEIIDLDGLDEAMFHSKGADLSTTVIKEEHADGTENDVVFVKEEVVDDEAPMLLGFKYTSGRKRPIDLTDEDWNPVTRVRVNPALMDESFSDIIDLTAEEDEPVTPEEPLPQSTTIATVETTDAISFELSFPSRPREALSENAEPDSTASGVAIAGNGELLMDAMDMSGSIGEHASGNATNLPSESPYIQDLANPDSIIGDEPSPASTSAFWNILNPTVTGHTRDAERTPSITSHATGLSGMSLAEKVKAAKRENQKKLAAQRATASSLSNKWRRPHTLVTTEGLTQTTDATDALANPAAEVAVIPTAEDHDDAMDEAFADSFYSTEEADKLLKEEYKRLGRKKKRSPEEDIEWRSCQNRWYQMRERNAQARTQAHVQVETEVEVIDADDRGPETEPEPENWNAGEDLAAKVVQRLQEKARAHRRTPGAQKLREQTTATVKSRLKKHELEHRAKIAKKSKGKSSDEQNAGKVKVNKSKSASSVPLPSKPGKPKLSKEEREKEALFMRMLSGGVGQGTTGGDNDNTRPEFTRRTKNNHNREDALKDLIRDIPKEDQKESRSEADQLRKACQTFPRGMVRADSEDGRWKVQGLNTTLRHHQLLGAAWMIDRERSKTGPRGGLLCDDMGFGKTLQSIALVLAMRADAKVPGATLIVAPSSVTKEWLTQIQTHVDPRFREHVILHRAGTRLEGLDIETNFESAFCVITTYEEIRASLKTAHCPNGYVAADQIQGWYDNEVECELGIFHRVKWHRVIFDEAHAVKSYISQTAHACYMLEASRRWLLTGSPLLNTTDEVYSYLLCLRSTLAGSREAFLSNFKNSENSMMRLQKLLEGIMLRRNYHDRFMQKKIIDLPKHTRLTNYIDLSRLERAIYDIVQRNVVMNINQHLREHRVGAYRYVLRMFTLSRQMTAHYMLGAETFRNVLKPEDRAMILQIITDSERGAPDFYAVTELRKTFARASAEFNGRDPTGAGDHGASNGQFGYQDPTARDIMGTVSELADVDAGRETCKICFSLLEGTVVETSCGHYFCPECIERQVDNDLLDEITEHKCKECGEVYTSKFATVDWKSPDDKKEDQKAYKENQDHSWIAKGDRLIPSAKLIAFKAQVQNWLQEDPNLKMIVYTQWIAIVKCLKRICQDEGWPTEMFTGKQKARERDDAKQRFINDPAPKILIATLKSGGVGLNLTAATRLINLDLWFNYGLESQVYHRIYRIGQMRETECVRVVCRNTVDEKVLKMQEKKLTDINKALGDDGTQKPMTLTELLSLFGTVSTDGKGNPFIIPDEESHGRAELGGVFLGGERGRAVSLEPEAEEEVN